MKLEMTVSWKDAATGSVLDGPAPGSYMIVETTIGNRSSINTIFGDMDHRDATTYERMELAGVHLFGWLHAQGKLSQKSSV